MPQDLFSPRQTEVSKGDNGNYAGTSVRYYRPMPFSVSEDLASISLPIPLPATHCRLRRLPDTPLRLHHRQYCYLFDTLDLQNTTLARNRLQQ